MHAWTTTPCPACHAPQRLTARYCAVCGKPLQSAMEQGVIRISHLAEPIFVILRNPIPNQKLETGDVIRAGAWRDHAGGILKMAAGYASLIVRPTVAGEPQAMLIGVPEPDPEELPEPLILQGVVLIPHGSQVLALDMLSDQAQWVAVVDAPGRLLCGLQSDGAGGLVAVVENSNGRAELMRCSAVLNERGVVTLHRGGWNGSVRTVPMPQDFGEIGRLVTGGGIAMGIGREGAVVSRLERGGWSIERPKSTGAFRWPVRVLKAGGAHEASVWIETEGHGWVRLWVEQSAQWANLRGVAAMKLFGAEGKVYGVRQDADGSSIVELDPIGVEVPSQRPMRLAQGEILSVVPCHDKTLVLTREGEVVKAQLFSAVGNLAGTQRVVGRGTLALGPVVMQDRVLVAVREEGMIRASWIGLVQG